MPQKSLARRWFEATLRASSHVAAVAVILIMLVTIADVLRRQLVGRSIVGGLELTKLLLVAAVWLGLGDAERTGLHVRTNVVTRRLSDRGRRTVRTIGLAVMTLFLSALATFSVTRAIESTADGEYEFGLARIPVWPARLVLMAGALLIVVQVVLELGDILRGRGFLPDADLETVTEPGASLGSETTPRLPADDGP